MTWEQTEARWRHRQQRSSLVTAQPLVPVEEDDNSGILEQYSQGDENEEEENEGGVRNDAPLIAQRQTSARNFLEEILCRGTIIQLTERNT